MTMVIEPTVKTVREYDAAHDELLVRAINRYGSDAAAKKIDQFLSKRSAKNLSYFNRHVRHTFRTNLQMHVARIWPPLEKQQIAVGFFTFVDRSWVTSEAEYAVDLVEIKRKVRNALIKMNFIAAIEHAVYSNRTIRVNGVDSKMLAIHVHAIVWTASKRQLERRRSKVAQRFDKIFPGQKSTVHCEKRVGLDDFLDTIGYMSKMDLSTYRVLDDRGAKQVNARTSFQSRYNRLRRSGTSCSRTIGSLGVREPPSSAQPLKA